MHTRTPLWLFLPLLCVLIPLFLWLPEHSLDRFEEITQEEVSKLDPPYLLYVYDASCANCRRANALLLRYLNEGSKVYRIQAQNSSEEYIPVLIVQKSESEREKYVGAEEIEAYLKER